MSHRLRFALVPTLLLSFAILASQVNAQPNSAPEPELSSVPEPTPTEEPTPFPTTQIEPVADETSPAPQYDSSPQTLKVTPENADIRIGVHRTSQPDDDYVRVGEIEPCLIRLNSPLGSNVNVVLTSPDDNFLFNGGTSANQLYLTLPGNGDAVQFSVIGVTASRAVGSSEIHAHVGYATSSPYTTANLTVFKLVNAKVSVERGGDYSRDTTGDRATYLADDPYAVRMYARISTSPTNVDLSAPQLRDLRTAIVQNVTSSSRNADVRSPKATSWDKSLNSGYTYNVPSSVNKSFDANGAILDTTGINANFMQPFVYDQSALAQLNGLAETSDSPGYSIDLAYGVANAPDYNIIVAYKYQTARLRMKDYFSTYCFLVDITDTDNKTALRETTWRINVDSSYKDQHAVPTAQDSAVSSNIKLYGPNFNSLLQAQSNNTTDSPTKTTLKKSSPTGSSAP